LRTTAGDRQVVVGERRVADDVGGEFWAADSRSSRIDLTVPANSSYLVRVVNKTQANVYMDSYEFPTYTLKIEYK
jgi:hypothetical protein